MQRWQVQYLCDWKEKAGLLGKASPDASEQLKTQTHLYASQATEQC